MIDMLKRHEIQVLRRADHSWREIAALTGVSVSTAQRVVAEDAVTTTDNAAERARRQVGRPSKAEAYRDVLVQALTEQPTVRTVELLHRARQAGYTGSKSAVYALAQTLRVRPRWTPQIRPSIDVKTGHHRRATETVGFYFEPSVVRKSEATFVRQLRGPHLSTCA